MYTLIVLRDAGPRLERRALFSRMLKLNRPVYPNTPEQGLQTEKKAYSQRLSRGAANTAFSRRSSTEGSSACGMTCVAFTTAAHKTAGLELFAEVKFESSCRAYKDSKKPWVCASHRSVFGLWEYGLCSFGSSKIDPSQIVACYPKEIVVSI